MTGSRVFTLLMLAIMIWSLGYAAELASVNLSSMLFWAALEYVGIATGPVLLLILSLLYTGRQRLVTVRNVSILFVIPVLTILAVSTESIFHLQYGSVSVDTSGPFPLLAEGRGPWFWVHAAYSYAALLAGTLFLILRLRHPNLIYRKQIASMLVGVAVPWIVNILYLAGVFKPLGHRDVTPFVFPSQASLLPGNVSLQSVEHRSHRPQHRRREHG